MQRQREWSRRLRDSGSEDSRLCTLHLRRRTTRRPWRAPGNAARWRLWTGATSVRRRRRPRPRRRATRPPAARSPAAETRPPLQTTHSVSSFQSPALRDHSRQLINTKQVISDARLPSLTMAFVKHFAPLHLPRVSKKTRQLWQAVVPTSTDYFDIF